MINLNLKYNNDDEKKVKKNWGIGHKNCWIKKWISELVVD